MRGRAGILSNRSAEPKRVNEEGHEAGFESLQQPGRYGIFRTSDFGCSATVQLASDFTVGCFEGDSGNGLIALKNFPSSSEPADDDALQIRIGAQPKTNATVTGGEVAPSACVRRHGLTRRGPQHLSDAFLATHHCKKRSV